GGGDICSTTTGSVSSSKRVGASSSTTSRTLTRSPLSVSIPPAQTKDIHTRHRQLTRQNRRTLETHKSGRSARSERQECKPICSQTRRSRQLIHAEAGWYNPAGAQRAHTRRSDRLGRCG